MTSKAELESALKDAMRAGDNRRKSTIRMALSAIKFNEIEKGVPMDDAGVMAALQKEVKARREAIADAEKAGRPELIADAQAEMLILESFLPQALSAEELEALVREAIAESGATGPKQMGLVMKLLTPRLQGRASGDQASQAVRRLLQ